MQYAAAASMHIVTGKVKSAEMLHREIAQCCPYGNTADSLQLRVIGIGDLRVMQPMQ